MIRRGLRRTLRWLKRLLILAVLAAIAGGGIWYFALPPQLKPRYSSVAVSHGRLAQTVTSGGQLEPAAKVEVGSQISGTVRRLFVDFDSPVKAGQALAQIDPASYEASLSQTQGSLANAQAALQLAQLNLKRAEAQKAEGLIAQSEYDKAQADLRQAEAEVKVNEGAVQKARVDLDRCTIRSPIDGVVISRNVSVGQTLSSPTLFVIADDLSRLQIGANVAEADIGSVRVGQDVEFGVDAFPGKTFRGKVKQIRSAPTTDQNVVTYQTVIDVDNPMKLRPGMTANISIIVASHDNALRIPNAALRFRPPDAARVEKDSSLSARADGAPGSEKHGRGAAAGTDGSPGSGEKHHGTPGKAERAGLERTVWVLASEEDPSGEGEVVSLRPVHVRTGLSDSKHTEVVEGLEEGEKVVTGVRMAKADPLDKLRLLWSQAVEPVAGGKGQDRSTTSGPVNALLDRLAFWRRGQSGKK